MRCEKCREDFAGEKWQKLCRKCYATAKNEEETKAKGSQENNRDQSIVRQVCFKCAAQVMPAGSSALDLITYAKKLEEGFYQ